MNLILVTHRDLDDEGRVVLEDRRAQHVRCVLRATRGDELRIGMIRGRRGIGRVVTLDDRRVTLEAQWDGDASFVPKVDLVLAMPRPKVLARVLQTAACMGVRRIDVVNAWRVDKSYLDSPQLAFETLRDNLLLGCEQGGTTWVPDIETHRLLMPFMQGPLSQRQARERCRGIIAHPHTSELIERVIRPTADEQIIVAVGPERGWIDRELKSFAAIGFAEVCLGNRVLRVETAVTTLLAQISLLQRLRTPRPVPIATRLSDVQK